MRMNLLVLWIILMAMPGRAFAEDDFEKIIKPLLVTSCVKCHGKDKVKGNVNLFEIKSAEQLLTKPKLIAQIFEAVDTADMPPDTEPQLPEKDRAEFLAKIKSALQASVAGKKPERQQMCRLNRFQYNNSIRDLFQIKTDVFSLPEKMMTRHDGYLASNPSMMPVTVNVSCDALKKGGGFEDVEPFPKDLRASHGFDNQDNQLTLSPLLLESFLKLSVSIVNSPDFNEKTVGVWNKLFRDPDASSDKKVEIKNRLRPFLENAFRGPVDDLVLSRYVNYVLGKLDKGIPFTNCMKSVASAVLSSPKFLYRTTGRNGDQFALASKLSFFLWSSAPDGDLLALAGKGELSKPEVLNKVIDRMLRDQKIERFLDSFPTQWMQLENILSATPDEKKFKDFYVAGKFSAGMQMILEPLLLFDAAFIENRAITELIAPDFTYRSNFLQNWYASDLYPPNEERKEFVKKVREEMKSNIFRRVALPDQRYGGVITNAATLTMTSSPTRTMPIARGAWLIEVILNDPPLPPPNDVPPLNEDGEQKDMTIREKFAKHRENPSCAGCHARLDPLGFALENFDITGHWRDRYENGRDVDPSGTLMKKHDFKDIVQFKASLVAEKKRFAKAFTAHLLRFALARDLDPADSFSVDLIVEKTEKDDFKIKSIIREIIFSDSFLRMD